jgi:hypothetical protein
MRATRNYDRLLAAILLPVGAAAVALNLLADPYAASPATGLDRLEDARMNGTRAAKAERLSRGGFRTVVFGTSVVNQGCDPRGPAFGGERTFIAGLPGSNLVEMRRAFDFALDHGRPGTVVLSVDPVMASGARNYLGDFDQSLFHPSLRWPEYRLRHLLGGDPTLDSLEVLFPSGTEPRQRADGFRPRPAEVVLDWGDFTRTIRQYFLEEWNGYRYDAGRVRGLAEMAARCRREGIRAVIVIPPFHAVAMEGMRVAGIGDDFDRLRRDLAAVDAECWDFSGWTGPRAEPAPLEGRGTMRSYSDPIHCMASLGAVFTARALGREDLVPAEFRGFGVRLGPATLDAHLAALRRDGEEWREAHADEAARLSRLFESTGPERSRRLRLAGADHP